MSSAMILVVVLATHAVIPGNIGMQEFTTPATCENALKQVLSNSNGQVYKAFCVPK